MVGLRLRITLASSFTFNIRRQGKNMWETSGPRRREGRGGAAAPILILAPPQCVVVSSVDRHQVPPSVGQWRQLSGTGCSRRWGAVGTCGLRGTTAVCRRRGSSRPTWGRTSPADIRPGAPGTSSQSRSRRWRHFRRRRRACAPGWRLRQCRRRKRAAGHVRMTGPPRESLRTTTRRFSSCTGSATHHSTTKDVSSIADTISLQPMAVNRWQKGLKKRKVNFGPFW